MSKSRLRWAVAAALLLSAAASMAQTPRADWPHWRGPDRNGTTPELSGYDAKAWPPGDPLWTRTLPGTGETSPIVAEGKLFTMAWANAKDTVYCLDARTGKDLWQQSYAARDRGRHAEGDLPLYSPGPISTPEFDAETGYLYTLGVDGELACWNTRKGGARVWGLNLYDAFNAPQRPDTGSGVRDYGYTTAPLVLGKWVVVEVGASAGHVMAFDKRTGGSPVGTPAWRSANTDNAGHSGGLIPVTLQGVPCVAALAEMRLVVLRTDAGHEGQLYTQYPYVPRMAANVVTPAIWQDLAVLSTHFGPEDALVKLAPGTAVKKQTPPHSEVGTPVFADGRLYRGSGYLECWEMAEGKGAMLWRGGNCGNEATLILTGDKRLIAWGAGRLALYSAADGARLAEKPDQRTGYPHIALAQGLLYTKTNQGLLQCFGLAGK